MMNSSMIKEAHKMYWIVKGSLIPESWSDADIEKIYNNYVHRIWGNHENVVHEEGFEEAWSDRLIKDLEKVAILGYN